MRFAIIRGLPYLISGGKKYPVAINRETGAVRVGKGRRTRETGQYTLIEVLAKCRVLDSITGV